jgi:hypothetical protein
MNSGRPLHGIITVDDISYTLHICAARQGNKDYKYLSDRSESGNMLSSSHPSTSLTLCIILHHWICRNYFRVIILEIVIPYSLQLTFPLP